MSLDRRVGVDKLGRLLSLISEDTGWEYRGSYAAHSTHNRQYWFHLSKHKRTQVCLMVSRREPETLKISPIGRSKVCEKHHKIDLRYPGSVDKLKNFFTEYKQECEGVIECGIITSAKKQMKAGASLLTSLINSTKEK